VKRTLQMNFPDDLDAEIEAAVSIGEYPSTEAVFADALEQWRATRRFDADELKQAWDQGVASGVGQGLSIDEIKSEARRRLAGE
jgi:Arc/MetJ-type ribon-helix-helix transcriptional regulator